MGPRLSNHFFISDDVIRGVYSEKKSQTTGKCGLCFYLIMVADLDQERELFINAEFRTELISLSKEQKISPAFVDAAIGVIFTGIGPISPEELLIKKASAIAARKSPDTFRLLVTVDEKKKLAKLARDKGYNLKIISAEDLLNSSGIDYPLQASFMGQLARFSKS